MVAFLVEFEGAFNYPLLRLHRFSLEIKTILNKISPFWVFFERLNRVFPNLAAHYIQYLNKIKSNGF